MQFKFMPHQSAIFTLPTQRSMCRCGVFAHYEGECQGLAEEPERERNEQASRCEDLAAQLADMTAARDALAYAVDLLMHS
jgi:hypothetical protein